MRMSIAGPLGFRLMTLISVTVLESEVDIAYIEFMQSLYGIMDYFEAVSNPSVFSSINKAAEWKPNLRFTLKLKPTKQKTLNEA